LRSNEPPIIARIARERVMIDMRTVLEVEQQAVLEALVRLGDAMPRGGAGSSLRR
jgi:seryl-tRNA(Sec) selenium transferase